MSVILINGERVDKLTILDRGFQYGDGLFETLRIQAGQPCHWTRHLTRLCTGCKRLGIPMPEPNLLYAEAMEVVAKRADGVLKLIVTRGSGPRGYAPPETLAPMRIVFATPASVISATYACEGVAVRLCDTRLAVQPALAGIKHLNRLEQVLARAEWRDPQIAEGLMLDTDDNVIEGTMSNLFCVRDGALYTPELDRCGVRGITRERILEHARAVCLPAHEIRLRLDDLYAADELFICNTFMGIWPVRRLVGHPFVPGPVTRRLAAALEASND